MTDFKILCTDKSDNDNTAKYLHSQLMSSFKILASHPSLSRDKFTFEGCVARSFATPTHTLVYSDQFHYSSYIICTCD